MSYHTPGIARPCQAPNIGSALLTIIVHANEDSHHVPKAYLSSTMSPTSFETTSEQDCINPTLLSTLDDPFRLSTSSLSSNISHNHVSEHSNTDKGNDDRGDNLKNVEELLMRCGIHHPLRRHTRGLSKIIEGLSDLCECIQILVGNQPSMDVDTEVVIQPWLLTSSLTNESTDGSRPPDPRSGTPTCRSVL